MLATNEDWLADEDESQMEGFEIEKCGAPVRYIEKFQKIVNVKGG